MKLGKITKLATVIKRERSEFGGPGGKRDSEGEREGDKEEEACLRKNPLELDLDSFLIEYFISIYRIFIPNIDDGNNHQNEMPLSFISWRDVHLHQTDFQCNHDYE